MNDHKNGGRLVYFEHWTDDAAALAVLSGAREISVRCLNYADAKSLNWAEMGKAHGYQIASRVELKAPWHANAELISRCPQLLAVTSTGAGYDVIDVEACTAAGVIVCNQSGSNARAVAEHAVGMMIALSKRIFTSDRAVRENADTDRFAFTGNNLEGKTVGILGLGNIGRLTARICNAGFGMKVLAHDPYLTDAEIVARGAIPVSRDDVFSTPDFVSIHCPRSAETFGSIGLREFGLMRPTAFFINTARGGIHREDELAQALNERRIAGAGLDVFLEEPPAPSHPLMSIKSVIATPHIAGMTAESQTMMSTYAARQWIDIFAGKVPPRLINPVVWPQYSDRFESAFGFRPASLN